MSASSHTRDHRFSAELTAAVLAWLVRWGRRVVNGPGALDLEISKARQYAALEGHGIATPRTVLVAGREHVAAAALRHFRRPAGHPEAEPRRQGAGRAAVPSPTASPRYVASDAYEAPVDGLHLLQEYVRAPRPFITRAEFVGGRFLYAVEVDTSDGFELCPADACADRRRQLPGRARRHATSSPSSTGFRTRCACGWSVSWRQPASRSRASSSSPTRRPHAGVRREHQHELQSGRGSARRPHRHRAIRPRRDRRVPRRRTASPAHRGVARPHGPLLLRSERWGYRTRLCDCRRSSAVEQLIRNQQALGSSPSVGTNEAEVASSNARKAVHVGGLPHGRLQEDDRQGEGKRRQG